MSQQVWHCDEVLLRRYDLGEIDFAAASSVEAHLLRCAQCRSALAAVGDTDELGQIWVGVRESIQRPRLPAVLRLLRACGLGERDAVLLSASQSLRTPWTLATVALLVCAALAAFPDDPRGKAIYMLVAPLIPVLSVVAAFATTDSMVELTNATPYSKMRLALLRTMAVTVTTVPLVVLLGTTVPEMGWLSIAWLGPALGLTLAALVALTWWRATITGTVVSVGWLAVVSVAYSRDDLSAAVQFQAQLGYLVFAVLTAFALAVRIRSAHSPGGYA